MGILRNFRYESTGKSAAKELSAPQHAASGRQNDK
jgi:hypothetical protein